MKTTFGDLCRFDPCYSFRVKLGLHKNMQLTTEISILEILNSNGIEDAVWALRTQEYKSYCLFLADVAQSVLHIFEKACPGDMRVRNLIAGIRRWHAGDISDEQLADYAAAVYAAAYDGYYATAAGYAGVAGYYATAAGYAAADYAAAAYASAYAVDASASARATARREQWNKIEGLLRKHLGRRMNMKKK